MKRLTILAVALALFAACGDDTPVSPSVTAPTFTAILMPSNEVPAVTNAEASGSGTVTITLLNIVRDSSGAVTSATADFLVTLTGFPSGTPVTAAHIHNGRAGANAGTINNLGIAAGELVIPASGGLNFTKTNINFTQNNQIQNMLNDPAGFYFNVHSTSNPGGFARGQLVRVQ